MKPLPRFKVRNSGLPASGRHECEARMKTVRICFMLRGNKIAPLKKSSGNDDFLRVQRQFKEKNRAGTAQRQFTEPDHGEAGPKCDIRIIM